MEQTKIEIKVTTVIFIFFQNKDFARLRLDLRKVTD